MPITVVLNKRDEHHARMKGADTVAICRAMNFQPRNETMGEVTRESGTIDGFRSEYAVARLFELDEPEINIESDNGIDFFIGDTTVDVKCTRMKDPALIFDSMDKFKADVAILTSVTGDTSPIQVWGWITPAKFQELAHHHNFGYGDRLVMNASDLLPIESFWLNLQKKKYRK